MESRRAIPGVRFRRHLRAHLGAETRCTFLRAFRRQRQAEHRELDKSMGAEGAYDGRVGLCLVRILRIFEGVVF